MDKEIITNPKELSLKELVEQIESFQQTMQHMALLIREYEKTLVEKIKKS